MSRHALHIECIKETLRTTRAARTKAMELPVSCARVAVLESLRVAVDALQEALAVEREAMRAEERS